MQNYRRAIVVPVYNEAASLVKVIESILKYKDHETKLILVQDGSSDGSGEILLKMQESGFLEEQKIDLVNHSVNQGYGKALISGFKKALEYSSVEYILTMDCDEQHQPEDIGKFFNHPPVDLLSASRYLADIEKGIKAPEDRVQINKKITEKYIEMAQERFQEDWKITDTFCGMKRYHRNFLQAFIDVLPEINKNEACLGYGFPLIVWNFYLYWLRKNKRSLKTSFSEIPIAKIYISDDRSFGENLDFPRKRYRYYLQCMSLKF